MEDIKTVEVGQEESIIPFHLLIHTPNSILKFSKIDYQISLPTNPNFTAQETSTKTSRESSHTSTSVPTPHTPTLFTNKPHHTNTQQNGLWTLPNVASTTRLRRRPNNSRTPPPRRRRTHGWRTNGWRPHGRRTWNEHDGRRWLWKEKDGGRGRGDDGGFWREEEMLVEPELMAVLRDEGVR